MVDALVLEASTSVCGFESHLPHQKKRAPKGAFFFWRPLRRGLPLRSTCGRNLRFPHTRPLLFVIPYSLQSKRTAPATGRGLEPNCAPGFFFAPNLRPVPADLNLPGSKKAPGRVPSFALYHRLPQDSPSRIRAAERHTKTIHSSLFTCPAPAFPSHSPGEPESCSQQGGGGSVPRRQCGTAKRPFPRTAPHAGHRLILNPCRRAALRNYSLFTLLYSLVPPRPFPPTSRERQRTALSRG